MNTRALFLTLLLFSPAANAQGVRGAITGIVTDAARKPVAAAAVRVVHAETNRARGATTGNSGEFTLAGLPPGEYRLEAAREGYREHFRSVELLLNQEVRIEIALLPGLRTESVQVSAVSGLLNTESSALCGVLDNSQITGLPLDGRNFYELSLLLAGVAPPAPGSAGSVRGDFAVSVNGAREDSNNFLLDGVFNGDPKLNGIGLAPPVDAVREVEVAAGAYDASFGRNSGAQVSVMVKSGANRLHGAAYEFFRNRALDARNFFAPAGEASPRHQRNQFGFSAGGPLVRDRIFFFADYEGRRVREGITRLTNVPDALERTGDFSLGAGPVIDPFTQSPFPGNLVPRHRLNPVGAAVAALYPLPNRPAAGRNFASSPAARDREDHFDARIDHHPRPSDDLAFRYSFADRGLYLPFSGPSFSAVPGFGTDVPRRSQNAMARATHIFTPDLLNELTLGFSRVSAGSFHQNSGNSVNRSVGLPELSAKPRDFGLSLISVTGYSRLGDEYHNPQHGTSNVYQVSDTLAWARGRHLLKAGLDLRRIQQNAYRDEMARGYLSFLGATGNALAELLLGLPSLTGAARLDNHQHLRATGAYSFVQDTWRARPGLTVSAGLRYEYNSPPWDAQNRANIYDPASKTLLPVGAAGIPRGGYLPDRNNWAPRLGLSWRPGQGPTVIRGGYGIYYDQSSLAPGEGLYFNAPYFDFRLFFPLPQLPLTLADPFPARFPVTLPSSALTFQRDLRTAYIQHWSFGLQREAGRNRLIEAVYAASKGTKLLGGRDLNQPPPDPRQPNPRPVPQFDDITVAESRGNSSYQSLQARFQQRLRGGLAALVSYTWSKSIDDASSFFSSAGDANYPQDSRSVRAERGLSGFDLRHRLALAYSLDLPTGKGRWLGGWQTFGLWTFQTGRPFTVGLLPDLDNSNTGRSMLGFGANDRPDVLRNPSLQRRTPERWFDTAAFALPPFGRFGNSGRNILSGPGYRNISVSLVKNVSLAEGSTLQLRVEAFNLLNHANLDLPEIFLGAQGFGGIHSAGNPRRLQLGLKLLF